MPPVNKTWVGISTPGDYSVAACWLPSGVPVATDHVRIPAGSPAITAGLNQSAVALGDFIVEEGYTGTIGTSASYLQVDPDRFEFAGTGISYIDLGSAAIDPQIYKTASAGTGLRGLYLKGSALDDLSVMGGKVGLAVRSGETSTVADARTVGATADLWLGAGVTLTTYHQTAGKGEIRCAFTTATLHGGTLKIVEVGAGTTLTVEGGTAEPESVGTLTNVNANGGTIDATGSGASRTWTNFKQNPGSTVKYDPAVLNIVNRLAPDYPISLTAS